ncbi:MAG: WD40 repeat domain-containing protein, partial [Phycisphaerae bacterium]
GKTVVSGGGDKKLHVWNTADAKELRAMAGFGGEVFRVLVAAGDRVYSASADRNIREHNAADGQLIRTLSGHSDWVYTVTLNTARNVLATGSYDGEIRVWNSQDGSTQTSFIGIPKEQAAAANVTAVTK